jgi:hypothetical protein
MKLKNLHVETAGRKELEHSPTLLHPWVPFVH